MKNLTRRHFLKTSLVTTAALGLSPRSWAQVPGANDDIRVAVIGFNGRGRDHLNSASKLKGTRLTALCDVDKRVLDAAVKNFADGNQTVEGYLDIRKLLESKNVDAVAIATPNHWHSLASIWACQAGKDVYVEKPVSHNVWEGRKVVEAAIKYNRMVQAGTQSRSSIEGITAAVAWVRAGNLGKIKISRGLCYKARGTIGKVDGPQPIPPNIDYELWCGPAEKLPLMRKRLHYDWHWVWNTGNGDLGNQGIHEMDVARWFLGVNELSPRVLSLGGRLGYVDDGETPNTQIIFHEYPEAPLIFEVRGLPSKAGARTMDKYKGADIGIVIDCEGGHVTVPSYSSATAYDKEGKVLKEFRGSENHFANFIQAVRSRKSSELHGQILDGHLSSALCHTGNISYRLGKSASPEEIREALKADKDALETFGRMAEHLAANEVDLLKAKATLGVFLKMDPKTERFTNNDQANELLARNYRKPFLVPAQV